MSILRTISCISVVTRDLLIECGQKEAVSYIICAYPVYQSLLSQLTPWFAGQFTSRISRLPRFQDAKSCTLVIKLILRRPINSQQKMEPVPLCLAILPEDSPFVGFQCFSLTVRWITLAPNGLTTWDLFKFFSSAHHENPRCIPASRISTNINYESTMISIILIWSWYINQSWNFHLKKSNQGVKMSQGSLFLPTPRQFAAPPPGSAATRGPLKRRMTGWRPSEIALKP